MIKLKNVSASRAMRMHVSGQLVVAGGPAEEGVPGGIACRWSLSSSLSLNFMFDLGDEGEQVARVIRRPVLRELSCSYENYPAPTRIILLLSADKKRNEECQLITRTYCPAPAVTSGWVAPKATEGFHVW